MKKAVITTGAKQYLVKQGDELEVDFLDSDKKIAEFDTLLIVDGDKTDVGAPLLDTKVKADILEPQLKQDKVTSIRYKAKKRLRKIRGHRQLATKIKITSV